MRRSRPDRCPGVLRPWPADDGLLIRLRLPGGRVTSAALHALADVAERHGDGRIRVTSRANLQVRGLPRGPSEDRLREDVVAAIIGTGLLPSRAHDTSRNLMASPQSGLAGGRTDVRPLIAELDHALLTDRAVAGLPGRFLFILDDGRGDIIGRAGDLTAVALPGDRAQLRVGQDWSDVVPLAEVPDRLVALARAFLEQRGEGSDAPWHMSELAAPLAPRRAPEPDLPPPAPPLPFGEVAGGHHREVPPGGMDRAFLTRIDTGDVIVTPWRGVLLPQENR